MLIATTRRNRSWLAYFCGRPSSLTIAFTSQASFGLRALFGDETQLRDDAVLADDEQADGPRARGADICVPRARHRRGHQLVSRSSPRTERRSKNSNPVAAGTRSRRPVELAEDGHCARQHPGRSLGARPSAIISRLALDTLTRRFGLPSLLLPRYARSKSLWRISSQPAIRPIVSSGSRASVSRDHRARQLHGDRVTPEALQVSTTALLLDELPHPARLKVHDRRSRLQALTPLVDQGPGPAPALHTGRTRAPELATPRTHLRWGVNMRSQSACASAVDSERGAYHELRPNTLKCADIRDLLLGVRNQDAPDAAATRAWRAPYAAPRYESRLEPQRSRAERSDEPPRPQQWCEVYGSTLAGRKAVGELPVA